MWKQGLEFLAESWLAIGFLSYKSKSVLGMSYTRKIIEKQQVAVTKGAEELKYQELIEKEDGDVNFDDCNVVFLQNKYMGDIKYEDLG